MKGYVRVPGEKEEFEVTEAELMELEESDYCNC